MTNPVKVGLVGCGIISDAYFQASQKLDPIDIVACADLKPEAAKAKAEQHNIQAFTLDEIYEHPEIEIILNLTIPKAHTEVNLCALHAGKHVYLEKPLALSREEAAPVIALAESSNLRIGCAPDTFLGGAHQTCRKVIDENWIGQPLSGTAFMMCAGHESWHAAPDFYYKQGGGPLFDMGPYYITALINMLGPVTQVTALSSRATEQRTCTQPDIRGHKIDVEIDTHITALLQFQSGAIITMIMSFDVPLHSLPPIEIHGSLGSLSVPDPNFFGGEIKFSRKLTNEWANTPTAFPYNDNFRSIGLADMAAAIRSNRPHRASGKLAYHVLDVMCSITESAQQNKPITLSSTCDKPQAFPLDLYEGQLD
ncbi:Gfo/Idh/MocA family oxidoreductase [Planctomycetota bacterium]|nr:Gfo/Idh/MocA family oxidoreductase [Planctomycetota bacterium]